MEFGYSAHLSRDSGVRADPPTAERELANLAALRGKAYSSIQTPHPFEPQLPRISTPDLKPESMKSETRKAFV